MHSQTYFEIPKGARLALMFLSVVAAILFAFINRHYIYTQLATGVVLNVAVFAAISLSCGWGKALLQFERKKRLAIFAGIAFVIALAWLPMAILCGISGGIHALYEWYVEEAEHRRALEEIRAHVNAQTATEPEEPAAPSPITDMGVTPHL